MQDPRRADFDAEARKLFALLNLPADGDARGSASSYENLNAVWKHPTGGGSVYIGNITASSSKAELDRHNITHIVNCQDTTTANTFERDPHFHYFRFPVSHWWRQGLNTHDDVLKFFAPVFQFCDDATAQGHSVLIHCLAGAHRAGTTGVAFVMHATGLEADKALAAVKARRPIVNPIAGLQDLLLKFEAAQSAKAAKAGRR